MSDLPNPEPRTQFSAVVAKFLFWSHCSIGKYNDEICHIIKTIVELLGTREILEIKALSVPTTEPVCIIITEITCSTQNRAKHTSSSRNQPTPSPPFRDIHSTAREFRTAQNQQTHDSQAPIAAQFD